MTRANRDVKDFGWEIAHEAVSRRPPNPPYAVVARTHIYTYDATVWDLSIVQGPFSIILCQTQALRSHRFCIAVQRLGVGEIHQARAPD
jgi:hypothetical protein